jgi:hypothetical protein
MRYETTVGTVEAEDAAGIVEAIRERAWFPEPTREAYREAFARRVAMTVFVDLGVRVSIDTTSDERFLAGLEQTGSVKRLA